MLLIKILLAFITYKNSRSYRIENFITRKNATVSKYSLPKPILSNGNSFEKTRLRYSDVFNPKEYYTKNVNIPSLPLNNSRYYSESETPAMPYGFKLVWSDEFNGSSLDYNKWEHEINCYGGGNNEKQCYVNHADVIKVENGLLTIKAKNVPGGYTLKPEDKCNAIEEFKKNGACTNSQPTKSARIRTRFDNGHKWKFGRFEMKAKLPKGNYLWPAFWMLPVDYKYGTWAASGEMDIMESRGQNPNEVLQSLHYGAQWPNNVFTTTPINVQNVVEDFQIYGLDWDENYMKFYINSKYIYSVETKRNWANQNIHPSPYTQPGQPWDQEFHILLNLAVGGNFFPNGQFNSENDPKTWTNDYVIDYIRVYQ